jgi:hypothetical protein
MNQIIHFRVLPSQDLGLNTYRIFLNKFLQKEFYVQFELDRYHLTHIEGSCKAPKLGAIP